MLRYHRSQEICRVATTYASVLRLSLVFEREWIPENYSGLQSCDAEGADDATLASLEKAGISIAHLCVEALVPAAL